mmetsp:Transcript_10918/g.26205  ORF Transcript_10918/g.26205 Transcript_10918/m.26205 type:complete len:198 (+) Transcript_10918:94-687(+)|eukprot:1742325-Rhodomonas_salina.3
MPPYTRRPQQPPAEYSRDGEERLLTANWGSIAVVICALPWVALFTLNPISFFLTCFWMWVAWFVTLVPKLAYILLLELAIMQQRGREFLDTEQKRIRAVFPPFSFTRRFVELTVMELGSWFGGMEVLKEFRGTTGPIEPNIYRVIQLPLTVFYEGKSHVHGFVQVLWHYFCRFLALNIVAKLYTRHQPGSQAQVSSR